VSRHLEHGRESAADHVLGKVAPLESACELNPDEPKSCDRGSKGALPRAIALPDTIGILIFNTDYAERHIFRRSRYVRSLDIGSMPHRHLSFRQTWAISESVTPRRDALPGWAR